MPKQEPKVIGLLKPRNKNRIIFLKTQEITDNPAYGMNLDCMAPDHSRKNRGLVSYFLPAEYTRGNHRQNKNLGDVEK